MARANIRPAIFFGRSRPISTTHRPVRSPWQQCSPRGDGRSGCLGPGRVHLTTLNAGTARLSAWGTVTAATQASRRSPPPAAANHIPQPGAAAGRRHACIMIRRPHRRWHRCRRRGMADAEERSTIGTWLLLHKSLCTCHSAICAASCGRARNTAPHPCSSFLPPPLPPPLFW